MLIKKYTAKNNGKMRDTYLGKYLLSTFKLIDEIEINSEENVDCLIDDLERIHNEIYEVFSKQSRSKLSTKLLEKRLLKLEMVINELKVIEVRFRNDEEEFMDNEKEYNYDEEYNELVEVLEDDVMEALYCLN